MFDTLTETERIELTRKMARAAHRFLHEYELLKLAPPLVLSYYTGPGGRASDWLMAGVDCAESASRLMEPMHLGAGWTA